MRGRWTIVLFLLLAPWGKAMAQEQESFRSHWFLLPQVGVNWVEGEASFSKQLAPGAALSAGYQLTPLWGVRAGISGWQAHNWQAHPMVKYKWNFIQPQVDVTMSLTNLFGRWKSRRWLNAYAFLGFGMAFAFNNDEAKRLQESGGNFEELWTGSKTMPAIRGGIGGDVRLSERWALNVEAVANLLPERFNSKIGKKGGDWLVGLMIGVRYALGHPVKRNKVPAEVPVVVQQEPPVPIEPQPVVTTDSSETLIPPQPAEVVEEAKMEPTEIYFNINQYQVKEAQRRRLQPLVDYLLAHPETKVDIRGYADRKTGTRKVNKVISLKRCQHVRNYLCKQGVPKDQTSVTGYGDRVQPKSRNRDNRLVICVMN